MTEKQIARWIHENLSTPIKQAIVGTNYTEDLLGAMAMREVGFLIVRYVTRKRPTEIIHSLMKGDFSQRNGEAEATYHGFGYWQIDIGSYPDFIKSGSWKSPFLTAVKSVQVLEEKRKDLFSHNINSEQATVAAYNCGAYNVRKSLRNSNGKNPDLYTHNHDYSKEVFRMREIYKEVMKEIE